MSGRANPTHDWFECPVCRDDILSDRAPSRCLWRLGWAVFAAVLIGAVVWVVMT